VGLGDAKACAIGRTTEQILSKNGMSREDIGDNLRYQSQTVNELGLQIQAGSLDAVIVWDAMARYYEEYGEAVAIEAGVNVISSVDIGILEFSENKEQAGVFVDFLTSERGKAIFEKHGYSTAQAGQ
jgi:molybdate transport system substrate-binding protein